MESHSTVNPTLPKGYEAYAYEDPFEDHVGPLGYKIEATPSPSRSRRTPGTPTPAARFTAAC